MTKVKILLAAFLLVALMPGCKKDSNNISAITGVVTNNPVAALYGVAPAIPSSAAGAFYAVQETIFDSTQSLELNGAFAWFGNLTTTANAGVVTLNDFDTIALNTNLSSWYEDTGLAIGGPAIWTVGGSGLVAGFNYTDNNLFPGTGITFGALSASMPFTVTINSADPFDVIAVTLGGSKGTIYKTTTNIGSVSFSVAEINGVTTSGDTHTFMQVTGIKTAVAQIDAKTYYFVKQNVLKNLIKTGP